MSKTFKHSGDLGDIIYSLPTIQKLGGGVLYLDPTGGEGDEECIKHCGPNRARDGRKILKFNQKGCDFITPLLKEQKYIHDVKIWNGEQVTCNLNKHRELFATHHPMNLAEQHLKAFNVSDYPYGEKTEFSLLPPWLEVPDNGQLVYKAFGGLKKSVVSRSLRYQTQHNVWGHLFTTKHEGIEDAIFFGTPLEHQAFNETFSCNLPLFELNNALEAAQIIKHSRFFFGNQSFFYAIMIGLGSVPNYLEVCQFVPNTLFSRPEVLILH